MSMNVEYLFIESRFFLLALLQHSLLKIIITKMKRVLISENKTVSLAPTRVKQGLHLINKC